MDNGDICLPFKVFEEAESKSFEEGFRCAWFRCKINKISYKKGVIRHRLEFFDYPDEKVRWVNLFQKPPYANRELGLHDKSELMLRPRYPPFYCESEQPNVFPEADVIVIHNDTWKTGDLVDWWCDGCFWSGRINQILGSHRVQIKLPDPPVGQGCFYVALCKDLRPSLDWSQENGWMVPFSGEPGNAWYCARLNWKHEEGVQRKQPDTADIDNEVIEAVEASSIDDNVHKTELSSCMNSPTECSLVSADDTDVAALKYLMLASSSGSLESSIMNLEEVTSKIRWLKGLLKFGFQWPDLMFPSWKFLDSREEISLRR